MNLCCFVEGDTKSETVARREVSSVIRNGGSFSGGSTERKHARRRRPVDNVGLGQDLGGFVAATAQHNEGVLFEYVRAIKFCVA